METEIQTQEIVDMETMLVVISQNLNFVHEHMSPEARLAIADRHIAAMDQSLSLDYRAWRRLGHRFGAAAIRAATPYTSSPEVLEASKRALSLIDGGDASDEEIEEASKKFWAAREWVTKDRPSKQLRAEAFDQVANEFLLALEEELEREKRGGGP